MSSPSSTTPPQRRRVLPWIAGAMALLAAIAFARGVAQEFFVGDDAYISFRYARHLAEGAGPVWNPGERVEGYTNFSWVVAMAAAIRLGADPELAAPAAGIVSGLLLLAGIAAAGARRSGWDDPWIWVAPAALALNRSFTAWCTGGLETMAFAALIWFAFDSWGKERSAPRTSSAVLFALAALTRPEGLLFAAVAAGFTTWDRLSGRVDLRRWLIWGTTLVVPVAIHFLWRHQYYGEWLPNTFYAKVPGAWWEQGRRYLGLFHGDYRLGWFVPLALWGALSRRETRGAPALAAALYLAYVAYVGGDRFEFRFLVPILPFAYVLTVEGLRAAHSWRPRAGDAVLRWPALLAAAGLLATSGLGSRSLAADQDRHGVAALNTIRYYVARRADEGRFLRRQIEAGRLPADLTVCVGGAGALPYFTRWPMVDRRGINDATIARQPLAERGLVAHERDASLAYLRRRGVVVFDIFNRLVHTRDITRGRPPYMEFDGESLRVLALPLEDRFMIFATPLSTEELERRFPQWLAVSSPPAPLR